MRCRSAKKRLAGWAVWQTEAAGFVAAFVIGLVVWSWWVEEGDDF